MSKHGTSRRRRATRYFQMREKRDSCPSGTRWIVWARFLTSRRLVKSCHRTKDAALNAFVEVLDTPYVFSRSSVRYEKVEE